MREVGHRGAVHREPRHPAHLDPLVVLHLGDRRAHHVHQLDRFAPLPGGGRAGEDDQALRVPAHAGGQVVDPEEVGEFVGVLGAPFHGVQEGQLAVQQDLAAAGEVDEDLGDAAAHLGLLDRGLDRGPLKGVERLTDLAGLVLAEDEPGRLGLHIDLFARREPPHDARQPDAGDVMGGLAQPDEVAHMAAADPERDDDRDQHRDKAENTGDGGLEQDVGGDRGDPLLVAVTGGLAHPLEVAEDLLRRGVPAFGVDRSRSALGTGGDHPVLVGRQLAGRCGAPVVRVEAAVLRGQHGEAGLVEDPALGDQVGQRPQIALAHAAGGEHRGHQGVLAGDGLPGAGDDDQRPALLVHLHVLQGVERGEEVIAGVDEGVVALQGLVAGDGVVLDLGAQRAESGQALEDAAHPVAGVAGEVLADVAGAGVGAEPGDGLVGGPGPGPQLAERVGAAPVGEVQQALPALALQGLDDVLDRIPQLLYDVADVQQLVGLPPGEVGHERPHGRQGHQRYEQQRHDLPADRLPAKAHGLPYVNPGARGWCSVNKRREPTTLG
ncbi:hypothetical protein Srufu_068100 [Streptomyces libani subsp. rufus]|nr:hypothetical protein Srufu_068100 [Streptomyces libani subsp. rufus]